jgi:hypothetical protein
MRKRALMMICTAMVCLPFTRFAQAGTVTGPIENLIVRDSDGLVYVYISGPVAGRPSCAAGTSYWMVPNETSDSGKRLYAALLAARMSGRSVQITGKNTCTRWGDGEDINYVQLL